MTLGTLEELQDYSYLEWARHKIYLDDSATISGIWDPKHLLEILCRGIKDWHGLRVLDIGANSGGLSIELARLGATVVALEPLEKMRYLLESALAYIHKSEPLQVEVRNDHFFNADKHGSFDVVLALGLVYHFRHPQLCLDYLGNLDSKWFFISTQTCNSDDLIMQNRKIVCPQFHTQTVLGGWHPSRPLCISMLEWAGFQNIFELTDPSLNFYNKSSQVTNSNYFLVEKGKAVDIEAEKIKFL